MELRPIFYNCDIQWDNIGRASSSSCPVYLLGKWKNLFPFNFPGHAREFHTLRKFYPGSLHSLLPGHLSTSPFFLKIQPPQLCLLCCPWFSHIFHLWWLISSTSVFQWTHKHCVLWVALCPQKDMFESYQALGNVTLFRNKVFADVIKLRWGQTGQTSLGWRGPWTHCNWVSL